MFSTHGFIVFYFVIRLNCVPAGICNPGDFRCTDGSCVPDYKRCNGVPDCRDRSDEATCGMAMFSLCCILFIFLSGDDHYEVTDVSFYFSQRIVDQTNGVVAKVCALNLSEDVMDDVTVLTVPTRRIVRLRPQAQVCGGGSLSYLKNSAVSDT